MFFVTKRAKYINFKNLLKVYLVYIIGLRHTNSTESGLYCKAKPVEMYNIFSKGYII